MLLDGKHALIYGGGGSIGTAVAKAFAREGACVHLSGRTLATLDEVADAIRAAGGTAETAEVDALDERAVNEYVDAVAKQCGRVDISFNLIGMNDVQGTPLVEMSYDDFARPVDTMLRSTFLTARAAARHMMRPQPGVILMFGGDGPPVRDYSIGGVQVAFQAMETLRRQLSSELGKYRIRVVTLQTGGIPESFPSDFEGYDAIVKDMEEQTLLNRAASLEDVGNVAAFAASDKAKSITASKINISAGAIVD